MALGTKLASMCAGTAALLGLRGTGLQLLDRPQGAALWHVLLGSGRMRGSIEVGALEAAWPVEVKRAAGSCRS